MAGHRKSITFYIDDNDCYICTSHTPDHDGYPRLWRFGRTHHMHRVLYEERFGTLPDEIVARHTCDNRLCINLDHVIPGTPAQNTQDITDRHRHNPPVGLRSGTVKLEPNQVREIRGSKETQSALAARFKVNQSTISRIRNNERWTHESS